jgi:hypothetical protein
MGREAIGDLAGSSWACPLGRIGWWGSCAWRPRTRGGCARCRPRPRRTAASCTARGGLERETDHKSRQQSSSQCGTVARSGTSSNDMQAIEPREDCGAAPDTACVRAPYPARRRSLAAIGVPGPRLVCGRWPASGRGRWSGRVVSFSD